MVERCEGYPYHPCERVVHGSAGWCPVHQEREDREARWEAFRDPPKRRGDAITPVASERDLELALQGELLL